MKISRFQTKLTVIFLLMLLIPTAFFTYLTGRILTVSLAFLADRRMEASLEKGLEIAQRLSEPEQKMCEKFAEEICIQMQAQQTLFDKNRQKDIERYLNVKLQTFPVDSIQIIDSEGKIWTSASKTLEDETIQNNLMPRIYHEKAVFSLMDGTYVRGIIPVLNDANNIIGAVVVSKSIESKLVKDINDIGTALKVYSGLGMMYDDAKRRTWTAIIGLIVISTLSSVVIAFFLARSVTKPILNLVKGAEEVAKGNLDYQVETKAKGEIGVLIEAFNAMTNVLKENRKKLIQAERVAAWKDIARRIAHEIKNPLTPIQLSIFRLQRNLKTEDEKYSQLVSECTNTISNEIDNLRSLADEFSKFAKMPEPKLETHNLNELIQDTFSLYEELPNNINLDLQLDSELPEANLDSGQFKQVLHNLVKNAIEAMSDAGGNLQVITSFDGEKILLEIADTGCGMSEEVKSKLFTPYFTTKQKGTGLGMAVVQRIIEQHDAELDVESQEGIGTKISIKLLPVVGEKESTDL